MTTTSAAPCGTRIGVGLDTARYAHHVTCLQADLQLAGKPFHFAESAAGYRQLDQALQHLAHRHPDVQFHVRIDAAGQYAANLEAFLRRLPYPLTISVGEPARNRRYREAVCPKRKADPVDSLAMARFALNEQPPATPAVTPALLALREVASRLEAQAKQSTRLTNQLHNLLARVFPELALLAHDLQAQWVLLLLEKYPTAAQVARAHLSSLTAIPHLTEAKAQQLHTAAQTSIASLVGPLAQQLVAQQVRSLRHSHAAAANLKDLLVDQYRALPQSNQLTTIIGIGDATAAVLTAKMVSIDRFATPAQLVNYFGVFPEEDSSGTDQDGQPKPSGTRVMSRKGNDLVRKYLWLAASTACQHNPAVRALYFRLAARGIQGGVAIGHCMRKLLHLVFAVWKTGKPFNPDHYPWENPPVRPAAAAGAGAPSPGTPPAAPAGPPAPAAQEAAAGHSQGTGPAEKVVTAATVTVSAAAVAVKELSAPPAPESTPPAPPAREDPLDFAAVRAQVTMTQVLRHLGVLDELRGSGPQRRGRCPIHAQAGDRRRTFSVHLTKNVFQCFDPDCKAHGNVLDFWAALRGLPLVEAARQLATTFPHCNDPGTEKRNP
jgi:transposase